MVTLIVPEVAVEGTVAEICVLLTYVYDAVTPLNFTDVTPEKLLPKIVIVLPVLAEDGLNEEIAGDGIAVTTIVFDIPVHPFDPVCVTK